MSNSGPTAGELVTSRGLDEKVKTIRELKSGAAKKLVDIGLILTSIRDNKDWKVRRNRAGGVAYRSFEEFCRAELGLSDDQAYRYLLVATGGFEPSDVAAIGVTKLAVVSKATDPATRRHLLGLARSGASKRRLEAETPRSPSAPKAPAAAPTLKIVLAQPPRPAPAPKTATARAAMRGEILLEVHGKFMQMSMRRLGEWLKEELVALGRWNR